MLRVAAALLAVLSPHHAAPVRLDVQPRAFSPYTSPLTVTAQLGRPARAGLRLVRPGAGTVGWLAGLRPRTQIELAWHGRLRGRLLPDGHYQFQLVAGRRVLARAGFVLDAAAPTLAPFRVSNGGEPFAGDSALLTTISPAGDSGRSRARIAFTLDEPATVTLRVEATKRRRSAVATIRRRFAPGPHVLVWEPGATVAPRTYLLVLTATDRAGNRRRYGALSPYGDRFLPAPVVRVLGIDASFARQSYAPGDPALLRVATDAPWFTLEIFRAPGTSRSPTPDALAGTPVTEPQPITWSSHENAPAAIRLAIGDWPTGLYYAELDAADGRVGYAPFVVRPAELGAQSRIAVVLPTNTWQAYNFYDGNGDGWGDTWYAGRSDLTVALDRPYTDRGVPPKINKFEIPFLIWLARNRLRPDILSEPDLDAVTSGADLARLYDLIVFPGHTEYVTTHEYDVVEQYRDAGGNLIFLSANNFFRRVVAQDDVLTRTEPWRDLGRPEAALLGAQYLGNDEGESRAPFVLRNTADVPWLWKGLGLGDGSLIGQVVSGYGIEIDATTAASPPGTLALAEIPDLLGPGKTAQMTYYETPEGAKVFDAGALDFVASVLTYPVNHVLLNLWRHLALP